MPSYQLTGERVTRPRAIRLTAPTTLSHRISLSDICPGSRAGVYLPQVWTPYRAAKWLLVGLLLLISAIYVVSVSRNVRLRLPLEALLIMFSAEGYMLFGRFSRGLHSSVKVGHRGPGASVKVSLVSRKTLLRAGFFCLIMGLFIYNSSADIVAVAGRVLP